MDLRHLALILDAAATRVQAAARIAAAGRRPATRVWPDAYDAVYQALDAARKQAVVLQPIANPPLRVDDIGDVVEVADGEAVLRHLYQALLGRLTNDQDGDPS